MKTPLLKRIKDAYCILFFDRYNRRNRRVYTEQEKDTMRSMFKNGMTQNDIADFYGLTRDNIKNFLTKKSI